MIRNQSAQGLSRADKVLTVIAPWPDMTLQPDQEPFASVVAVPLHEEISAQARTCLQFVANKDGSFDWCDGVIALKGKYLTFRPHCPWPELYAALEKIVKAHSPLINTSPGEPPFLAVKILHEIGFFPYRKFTKCDGHAAKALKLLGLWNSWLDDKDNWYERLDQIWPKFTATNPSKRCNVEVKRLQQLAKKIGLKTDERADFSTPRLHLNGCLNAAFEFNGNMRSLLANQQRIKCTQGAATVINAVSAWSEQPFDFTQVISRNIA